MGVLPYRQEWIWCGLEAARAGTKACVLPLPTSVHFPKTKKDSEDHTRKGLLQWLFFACSLSHQVDDLLSPRGSGLDVGAHEYVVVTSLEILDQIVQLGFLHIQG